MIIDNSGALKKELEQKIEELESKGIEINIQLFRGDERIRFFKFQGNFEFIFEKILEVETFAFQYMADHECDLEAEYKVEPLMEK